MISWIQGTVVTTIRSSVVVNVGGVGYEVGVTADTLSRLAVGEPAELYTHHAVRETASDLFGFETRDELLWFEMLLTVSGIGPKSAMGIMNSADILSQKTAVASGDSGRLTAAFGIGKKTAEKLVLELRDKVAALADSDTPSGPDTDVTDALLALGYSQKEARETLRHIPKSLTSTEERIREAIRIASRS